MKQYIAILLSTILAVMPVKALCYLGGGTATGVPVGTLSIDSAATNSAATNTPNVAITTTLNQNVLLFFVFLNGTAATIPTISGVVDTAGLTWTKRSGNTGVSTTGYDYELWWAYAPTTLTTDTITGTAINCTATCTTRTHIMAINGANITTPFDPNSSLTTAFATGTSTATNTVSTTKNRNILVGWLRTLPPGSVAYGTITRPSGFTQVAVASGTYGSFSDLASSIISSPLASVAETYSWTGASASGYLFDAVQASGQ